MKAKMIDKPAEAGTYLCNLCNTSFKFRQGNLTCPKCLNHSRQNMVLIMVPENTLEEQMYTADDFHGG